MGETPSAFAPKKLLSHQEVQDELLKLLLQFDEFCKEHDLRYSLDYGTLLGAVRHKGFIPWDDDIDLSMPRPDLEWLLSHEDALPPNLRVRHLGNSEAHVAFPKIETLNVCACERVGDMEVEEHLWLDIFPMDGVPSGESGLSREWRKFHGLTRTMNWCLLPDAGPFWKRCVKHGVALLHSRSDIRASVREELSRNLTAERYEAAERVAPLLCFQKNAWSLDRGSYEQMVTLEFEGHELPAMSCWDEQLTAAYGDYMQLPPEGERTTHTLKAWRFNGGHNR